MKALWCAVFTAFLMPNFVFAEVFSEKQASIPRYSDIKRAKDTAIDTFEEFKKKLRESTVIPHPSDRGSDTFRISYFGSNFEEIEKKIKTLLKEKIEIPAETLMELVIHVKKILRLPKNKNHSVSFCVLYLIFSGR